VSTAAEGTPPSSSPASARRVRVRVDGTVQGVGYRPFVYRLADELGIAGWVLNDERGVLVEAEGPADSVEAFVARLQAEAPPLADVRGVEAQDVAVLDEGSGFEIVSSVRGGAATAPVTADSATCADCLAELADPDDRRYRYPFLNCTNCGPRFTIVQGIPYDRPATTMASFVMCEACEAEYEDPLDRRFHAQPNACPACGPQVSLLERDGSAVVSDDPLRAAVADLLDGKILAIKGLGGYHLACRADSDEAVAGLRARKHREDRPFALLVADVAAARKLAQIGAGEEALLRSRERPIVLARRLPDAPIADAVAPRAPELGIMLPYTPLHQLLAEDAGGPLVMTSGNVSDEPIAFDDADALERLAPIADRFLVHDRPIATRTDDSVVRVVRERPLLMRRSRGYVPAALDLPIATARHLLGTGAEQKNAFCVAKGDRAWPSHHIGDVKNFETLTSLRDGVAHFEALFEVAPEVVAHDLHPDYLSTRYAQEREGVELVGVQHHHAHFAATLAEHGETGPAVGAIYDGTGYGADGTIWGGEILVGGLAEFERAGRLAGVWMPGGEGAIREPWRMACSWLTQMNAPLPAAFEPIAQQRWNMVARMVLKGVGCTSTSSAGRLFDAVAAMCGVRLEVSYEGQAAIELEALADPAAVEPYPFVLQPLPPAIMNPKPAIVAVLDDLAAGVPVSTISARFHAGFATVTAQACALAAERAGVDLVVLSGGVFQNRLLLELTSAGLEEAGLRVLVPERLPPNDGQIAYGQVAVAAARPHG
jgi:hydrogenase maturation protein HypF